MIDNLERLIREGATPERILLSTQVGPETLARYAIGLANARGGLLIVGAAGGHMEDASDIHPLQITHAIFELSSGKLSVNAHHQQAFGASVMVVYVPQAPYLLASRDGEVLAWDGLKLSPIEGLWDRSPQAQPDFTATVPPMSSLSDIDPLEVGRLRRGLQGRASGLGQLADMDFLRELNLLIDVDGTLKPNLAGILMAGTPQALKRHIPQAEVSYYHHSRGDVEFSFREDLLQPLPAMVERLRDLIQLRNSFSPLQVGLFRIEVWDFDEVVYREAILNALMHRDYQLRDTVHIHHYPDRLEISNPGGLPGGITAENILRHQPKRRNPILAEALAKLGYVERAGVGVDKMYQLLLRHGKEPPEFTSYKDAVTLSIHNPGFDAEFVKFVARKQEEMQTFSLDMLIVLSCLNRMGEGNRADLATALQLPEDRIVRLLHLMEEKELIIRSGRGRASLYELARASRTLLSGSRAPVQPSPSSALPRPAQVTSAPIVRGYINNPELELLVLQQASLPEGTANAELRDLLGLDVQQTSRLLRHLVKKGRLRKQGTSSRKTRYYA